MTAAVTVEAEPAADPEGVPGRDEARPRAQRRHGTVATALGELELVAEGGALVGVYYAEHRPEPDRSTFGELVDPQGDAVLSPAADQLVDYVAGRRETFDLPLNPAGSERARQVWELVRAVPRGETTTYAALGRAVGVGPRVAGQMVARNPLCLVVPCHRVVASDGRLTGYAGGVDRKRLLLQLEGAVPAAPAPEPTSEPSSADGRAVPDEEPRGTVDSAATEARG